MDRTSRGNAHSAPHVAKHGTVTMIKFVATGHARLQVLKPGVSEGAIENEFSKPMVTQ